MTDGARAEKKMARMNGPRMAVVGMVALALGSPAAWAADPDALVEKLSSPNAAERRDAVSRLGQSGDRKAIGPLIGMLKDEEPMVRLEASGVLMDLGQPVADPLLAAIGTEKAPAFLWNAIRILEALGDPRAIEPLKKIAETNTDPNIVQAARYTIERLERIKMEKPPEQ
jgi:HEAT repeat protein